MKNQNKKVQQKLTPDEKEILGIFKDSKKLYLSVLAQLNFDHNDEVYANLLLGMIERQTRDQLLMSIWKNLDKEQAKHLRDYIGQMSVVTPWASNDDLLIEFAMMYPALMEKIYAGLSTFFQNFIKKFNEISGA
ncbi:hypothetical protein HZA40_01540 [Candidatus Peregrinibacteria bacterium]|nr:hypothetical protein [Candidatus Peregrinibacteria bacterium]